MCVIFYALLWAFLNKIKQHLIYLLFVIQMYLYKKCIYLQIIDSRTNSINLDESFRDCSRRYQKSFQSSLNHVYKNIPSYYIQCVTILGRDCPSRSNHISSLSEAVQPADLFVNREITPNPRFDDIAPQVGFFIFFFPNKVWLYSYYNNMRLKRYTCVYDKYLKRRAIA